MSTVQISGRLARDAELRFGTSNEALVHLVIDQGVEAPPVHAYWAWGTTNAAAAGADRAARRMRRGTEVQVHGAAVGISRRMPLDLQLRGVTTVVQLDLPVHHTERTGS